LLFAHDGFELNAVFGLARKERRADLAKRDFLQKKETFLQWSEWNNDTPFHLALAVFT
jgi:hypothetical protein